MKIVNEIPHQSPHRFVRSPHLSLIVSSLCLYLWIIHLGCSEIEEAPQEFAQTSASSEASSSDLPLDLRADGVDSQQAISDSLDSQLSAEEREDNARILTGIYRELHQDQFADPNQDCDRCGRETGFLPVPDLYLTQFIPVEMKALTLGLALCDLDESLSQEVVMRLFDEAPLMDLIFSYQLTLARVNIAEMTPEQREHAELGTILASNNAEEVSITSMTTEDAEIAITFEHGFSYVLSMTAIEGNTKLTSPPSSPGMVYCPARHDVTVEADRAQNLSCSLILPPSNDL